MPTKKLQATYEICNKEDKKHEEDEDDEEHDESIYDIKNDESALTDDAPLQEAWPIKHTKIGYLPMLLQKFLNYNSRKFCQESLGNNIKEITILVHYGVEDVTEKNEGKNDKVQQSFGFNSSCL